MAKVAVLPLINLTLNPAEATDVRDALSESSNKNAGKFPRIDESIDLLTQALDAFTVPPATESTDDGPAEDS